MGNYFLRKGTSKEATLFVRIRKRVPKIDKNVNTRIVIDRNVWERANKDAASLEKFYRTKDGQTIYRKMCAIDQTLEELLSPSKFEDTHIYPVQLSLLSLPKSGNSNAKRKKNASRRNKLPRKPAKKMYELSSMTSLQESERVPSSTMAIPIVPILVKYGNLLGLFLNASIKSTRSLGNVSTNDWWISFSLCWRRKVICPRVSTNTLYVSVQW